MRKRSILMIAFSAAVGAASPVEQESPLQITLAHGTEREARTKAEVEALVGKYDLERWLFTREVVIDEGSIPHSHPVLTLHTRHLGDEPALLATFLHEQFHWLGEARIEERETAIEDFRVEYPDAPYGRPLGGRDRYSTYLHLIVCDLEYQAMTILFDEATARGVLGANTHYEWIYERVLDDPAVRRINLRHGFDVESVRE